jgi:hypothetical protein
LRHVLELLVKDPAGKGRADKFLAEAVVKVLANAALLTFAYLGDLLLQFALLCSVNLAGCVV